MLKKIKKFSVVIPTKNRFEDLKKNIISILKQGMTPNELLIIDQSDKNFIKSIKKITKNNINLRYYHNREIKSLTEAKNFSLSRTKNEIIFFLEDDVILCKNYFKSLVRIFNKKQNILGVCGILINEKKINFFSLIYNFIFLNGIFNDLRPFFWNHKGKNKFIYSDKISGGISAWRKQVFKNLNFDKKNKLHLFEDVDFSIRVNKIWPNSTGIFTSAKVIHKWSPINRNKDIKLIELKLIEAYKFSKKNYKKKFNIDLLFFITGQFLNCLIKSILSLNLLYLKCFTKTLVELKKNKIYF